jgi:hypothetical protein
VDFPIRSRNEEAVDTLKDTSLRMEKARMSKSKVKAMMIIFFNIGGVIMI